MPLGILLGIYGQNTSALGWQINDVTLPYGPQKFSLSGSPNESAITQSGDEPIIVIDGLNGTILTMSGSISDDTKNDTQLWTDVLQPLLDLRGKEVTLVSPRSGLNGNWVLIDFQPSKDKGLDIYDYTMRLKKFSSLIVIDKVP
jgi:hypothetical protein